VALGDDDANGWPAGGRQNSAPHPDSSLSLGYRMSVNEEGDQEKPRVKRDPPEPRKVIPAVLFSVAILIVIFLVFAVITWARYHD